MHVEVSSGYQMTVGKGSVLGESTLGPIMCLRAHRSTVQTDD